MNVVNLNEIKTQILANKADVRRLHSDARTKEMLVIIKPTNSSTYKDLVDILDEMTITDIKSYAIDDKYIGDEEQLFLKNRGI